MGRCSLLSLMAAVALASAAGCASGPVARGNRAMDEGRFEAAAREYGEAAEADPDNAALWVKVADAETHADRPQRAREAWGRVALLRPTDPVPRIRIGFTWELNRRYDEATLAYRRAAEVAPADPRGYRVLGTRLLRWGEPGPAVEPLARAVEFGPGHAETWNALGLACYGAGDVDRAEATFREGLSLHPGHRPLYLGLAALLINAGRHAEALVLYDRVVARWDGFAAAHVGRGILLHELGRPDEAEAAFVRAVEVARDPRRYSTRLTEYRALRASSR